MDASKNAPASSQQQQQLASMIRPEQVKKLPHLSDDKKQQHEAFIQRLWDSLRNNPQGSPEYQKALAHLAQISAGLMAGMKKFNAQLQQQQHGTMTQQPGLANEAEGNRPAGMGIQANHILPHIQQKVNSFPLALHPNMAEGSAAAENWLSQARNRLAQMMSKAEHAKKRKAEIHRSAQTRNQSGNPLTQQEQEGLHTQIMQCNKAVAESNSFMEKFREQQTQFRASAQQQGHEALNHTTQVNTAPSENTNQADPSMPPGQPTQQGGPQAHSISSAVSAARDQATSAAANQTDSTSPTNMQPQPSRTPSGHQQQQQQQQPQQDPQSAMSQTPQNGAAPPFSTQSALQQPASNFAQNQPQSATHAHPPQSAGLVNPAKKEERPNIPRNLNVTAPRPVPMPSARPTLNGGPGVGMPGQMGEPAIPTMPGYVLETSEDGRVLSKKKLNELAREVCGPGEDTMLTPEAEEIFLNVADDFVDEVITSACKLAKLRGASSLEIRDVQLVLERQYNIRVPGFSSDEVRTVRRQGGTVAWQQKAMAVQAAKLTGGGSETATATAAGAGAGAAVGKNGEK